MFKEIPLLQKVDIMWNTYGSIVFTLISTWCVDECVIKPRILPKARFFLLHAVFNFGIVMFCWKDAIYVLTHPTMAVHGDVDGFSNTAIISTNAIAAFHVYHLLAFENLSLEDWIHHVISSMLVACIAVNLPYGYMVNLCNIGMCGLPGGLDYLLLVGVKYNYISRMTEKKYNSLLNVGLRWPIILVSFYLFCLGFYNGVVLRHVEKMCDSYMCQCCVLMGMFMGILMHIFNGVYYTQKVIGNYHVCDYMENMKNTEKMEKNE